MKKAYSEFRYLPKGFVDLQPGDLEQHWRNEYSGRYDSKDVEWFVKTTSAMYALIRAAKNGMCLHLFFQGHGFAEWLSACGAPYVEEACIIVRALCDTAQQPMIMLHFEGGSSPSVMLVLDRKSGRMWFTTGYKGLGGFLSNEGQNVFVESDEERSMYYAIKQLVCAGAAYIQAFPDMVRDGIPENLKHPNHYRKSVCKTIGIAPRLIIRDGPSPHYRVGHFRLLASERFTHKRGQVVFVHGCFVKGNAATVLSPEESEKVA